MIKESLAKFSMIALKENSIQSYSERSSVSGRFPSSRLPGVRQVARRSAPTLCSLLVDASPSRLLLSVEDNASVTSGVDAHLPVMMALVVKETNDRGSHRVDKFFPGIIFVTERRIEPLRVDAGEELLSKTLEVQGLGHSRFLLTFAGEPLRAVTKKYRVSPPFSSLRSYHTKCNYRAKQTL